MARDFIINGNSLCLVLGHGALSPSGPGNPLGLPGVYELGLTSESITIIPRFIHKDIYVDDFGPEIPAEVMCNIAEVRIRMTLVHYDREVLENCMIESMGGGTEFGTLTGAGTPMGGGKPIHTSGNHYIGLNILSTALRRPWYFPSAYIETNPYPLEIPIGTERTLCKVNWRAIPYVPPVVSLISGMVNRGEIRSSGVILWDNSTTLIVGSPPPED